MFESAKSTLSLVNVLYAWVRASSFFLISYTSEHTFSANVPRYPKLSTMALMKEIKTPLGALIDIDLALL